MGIHPSTYYRWRRKVERYGVEMLRPRERRQPRMPNATPVLVERRVIAFSLAHPGFGPERIAAELGRAKWGGIEISPSGVYRVLRRHGLNTRAKRLSLVAGYAAPPEPEPRPVPEPQHLEVDEPGELVQLDCFRIGRLAGTKGVVWQYTAIDVGSAYAWAELHVTPHNPSVRYTTRLVRRVARDLKRFGWKLEAVMTDNGSEFRAHDFRETVQKLGAVCGNGSRAPCSRSAGSRPSPATVPRYTGLRRDLERYLDYYNFDRAHTGRWTRGRTPARWSISTVLGITYA